MPWMPPSPSEFWRAVRVYLAVAYEGPPPPEVAQRLQRLRGTPEGALYDSDLFERADEQLALRLGNRLYQHMKLIVRGSRSGAYHYRADTHDQHVLQLLGPSAELEALVAHNRDVARAIHHAWAAEGLRTSDDHWRHALARWHAGRR